MNQSSGQPEDGARVCLIDGWRQLDDDRYLVCPLDHRRLARLVAELPWIASILPLATEPTGGAEQGIPLRLDAVDLVLPGRLRVASGDRNDQIGQEPLATRFAEWVQAWHDDGAPGDGLGQASTGSLWSVMAWLAARLDWACQHRDDIGLFAAVLRQRLGACRRLLSAEAGPRRFAWPCPECGTQTLVRQAALPESDVDAVSWIECRSCGRLWSDDEYAQMKIQALRTAIPTSALLRASQIAVARPGMPARRVRVWAHRGLIAPIPGPWGAKAVYLLSDVDKLWQLTNGPWTMTQEGAIAA